MESHHTSFAARAEQINHDMRTPIGTLAAAMDLIESPAGDSASFEETRLVMQRQLARLTALADQLRELAAELAQSE